MSGFIYTIPYLSVFFILFVLCFPLLSGKKTLVYASNQKMLALFILILFLGFRAYLGNDWVGYSEMYEAVPTLFDSDIFNDLTLISDKNGETEKGFLLYAVICKTISSNYIFFQAVSSIINLILLYIFLNTYIPNNIIMGFIFFLLFQGFRMETSLLRNSKAILLFLISLKYIEKRKILPYMGINIIGCLFHISAVLYLPLYFFINKQHSTKIVIVLFLLGNIVFLLQIKWITNILFAFADFVDFRLSSLIKRYLTDSYYAESNGITLGYLERNLSFFVIFIFCNKLLNKSKINVIIINCAFIYWFIYLYCSELFIITQRIPILFAFPYWILYPQLYSILSKEKKSIFLLLLLIYGCLVYSQNASVNYKYENILFEHSSYSQSKKRAA
jgi:hypothetical protein